MARTWILLLLMISASAAALSAQTGAISVSATILEPTTLDTRAALTVRSRGGRELEVAAPVRSVGPEGQIVSVSTTPTAGSAGKMRVRDRSGTYRELTAGVQVPVGRNGKLASRESQEVVYRLEAGTAGGAPVQLSVTYLISPEA